MFEASLGCIVSSGLAWATKVDLLSASLLATESRGPFYCKQTHHLSAPQVTPSLVLPFGGLVSTENLGRIVNTPRAPISHVSGMTTAHTTTSNPPLAWASCPPCFPRLVPVICR